MKKSMLKLASVIGVSALVLSGCATAPETATPGEPTEAVSPSDDTSMETTEATEPTGDFKACMVSDAGGFDDKSFNETAYNGLMQAKDAADPRNAVKGRHEMHLAGAGVGKTGVDA